MGVKQIQLRALIERQKRSSMANYLHHLAELADWHGPGMIATPVVRPNSKFLIMGQSKTGKTHLHRYIQTLWPQAEIWVHRAYQINPHNLAELTGGAQLVYGTFGHTMDMVIVTYIRRVPHAEVLFCAKIMKNLWHPRTVGTEFNLVKDM